MFALVALVVLAATYAFADRFAGGGWPALDNKLPGRAAFWGGALGAAVGFLFFGAAGALIGLAWLIWRTPAWKLIPPGSATPRKTPEILATFARHALVIPFAVLAAYWTGDGPTWVAVGITMSFFAAGATGLAALYAAEIDKGKSAEKVNHVIETVRGLFFGLCVAVGLSA